MEHKFECYKCGQHMSAAPELIGIEAACPTCNEPFIVPAPQQPDLSDDSAIEPPELAGLITRVRTLGFDIALPPAITPEVLQWHVSALDEFLSEHADLLQTIEQMASDDELNGQLAPDVLHSAGNLLLRRVMAGEWGGTPDEIRALLFEVAPNLRPRRK